MGASENIILGIVSGIFTSALLFGITKLFQNTIIPWYENLPYRGIDISGYWRYEMPFASGNKSIFLAEISRKADKVTCILSETKTLVSGGESEMRTYEFTGTLLDRFVTLTGRDKNKQSIGVYAILLEIKGDGKEMTGYITRHCITTNVIKSDPTTWKRSKT